MKTDTAFLLDDTIILTIVKCISLEKLCASQTAKNFDGILEIEMSECTFQDIVLFIYMVISSFVKSCSMDEKEGEAKGLRNLMKGCFNRSPTIHIK